MKNEEREKVFQDLISRICQVNLLNPNTFKKLEKLTGKCALVTYHHPNDTYRGRQRPNGTPVSWSDALKVASQLLRTDGCLLMVDRFRLGGGDGYGHCMVMEPVAHTLCMSLEAQNEIDGSDLVYMIWRKVPPNYNRIAEMNNMDNMAVMRIMRWSPEMPEIDNHAAKQEEEKAAEDVAVA